MGANDSKPLPPLSANDIIRFWSKVDIRGPEECWPWTAYTSYGYGIFRLGEKVVRANRVAQFLDKGADPFPLAVLHNCDNPPCCNPSHLFLGTGDDNIADKAKKGREARGANNGKVKLTNEQVLEIRTLYAGGMLVKELSTYFNVGCTCILQIAKRKTWKWLS